MSPFFKLFPSYIKDTNHALKTYAQNVLRTVSHTLNSLDFGVFVATTMISLKREAEICPFFKTRGPPDSVTTHSSKRHRNHHTTNKKRESHPHNSQKHHRFNTIPLSLVLTLRDKHKRKRKRKHKKMLVCTDVKQAQV